MVTLISDLLDVIHFAIIKNSESRENNIILDELSRIDEKIRSGRLPNYPVNDVAFFKHIVNNSNTLKK
jgi:hypothetical protein